MIDEHLAVTTTDCSSVATASTDNPAGIKDEKGTFRLMLLIPEL